MSHIHANGIEPSIWQVGANVLVHLKSQNIMLTMWCINKDFFQDDINSTHFFCKFREIVIYQSYMNLETILSDTTYRSIN
jgi:hypothetical protein